MMRNFSDKIYDTMRSVRLAAVLIVMIALLAVIGGIIPQGRMDSFYLEKFAGSSARIILLLGLDGVFTGIPFLVFASLFTINLTVCSFHRLITELKKSRSERRHGPDILHVGLIVLVFGAMLTARTRTEEFFHLGKGDSATLPDGSSILLVDLKEERYPDGRAKSWESFIVLHDASLPAVVDTTALPSGDFDTLGETGYMDPSLLPVTQNQPSLLSVEKDEALHDAESTSLVKVNSPLRHKGYTIYQQDWKYDHRTVLEDPLGMKVVIAPGERALMSEGYILLMSTEAHQALFLIEAGSARKVIKAGVGDILGSFTFAGFETESISGLKVVRDKGYPFVAAGLAMAVLGLLLTYIRRLKGMLA